MEAFDGLTDETIKLLEEYFDKYKSSIIDGYVFRILGSLYPQLEKGMDSMNIDKNKLDAERHERLNSFLKELGELTKKYKIEIGGCGCCGSPYLIDFEEYQDLQNNGYSPVENLNDIFADDLSYDYDYEKKAFSYTVDEIRPVIRQDPIDWEERYRYKGNKDKE